MVDQSANSQSTRPTYVDHLDLHEGPVETNREPLNRKLSGKLNSSTRQHHWHQTRKLVSGEYAYWCDGCDLWVDLGSPLPGGTCPGRAHENQPDNNSTTAQHCWPWSHQWTKWEPRVATFTDYGFAWQRDVKPHSISQYWQIRKCQRCGKLQQESMPWPEIKELCKSP